jgi:murein DD-endopeptidase MepM/ murein hydrolase activator NlpD
MSENTFIKFKTLLIIFCIAVAVALILYYSDVFKKTMPSAQTSSLTQNTNPATSTGSSVNQSPSAPLPTNGVAQLVPPIVNWQARVTKKPFGIYVAPQNSPVQPERFTGYHAGVDFETFADEQNIDVLIFAICGGKLLAKEYVSGYGGLVVQACKLDGENVTIIYGHLRPSSISAKNGEQFSAGQRIGVLGAGYSAETNGERKHLHLGIHKGAAINFLGYVQNSAQLDNWVDAMKYLK